MDNKDKKVLNDIKTNNSISLKKFLIFYCGICSETVLSSEITHNDVKELFPTLKRVSYEYILKNIKEIYVGNIIMAKDTHGNYAPYINPKIDVFIDENVILEPSLEKDKFEEVVDLADLHLYELVELARKYKSDNRLTEYRKVCRIIKKRKDNDLKVFHEKKEKMLKKGMNENDKY